MTNFTFIVKKSFNCPPKEKRARALCFGMGLLFRGDYCPQGLNKKFEQKMLKKLLEYMVNNHFHL